MLSDTEDFVSVWGVINVQCNWCPLQCNGLLSDFFQRNKKLWKMCFIIPLNAGMYLFIYLFLCISSWGFRVVGWAKIVHMLKFCFSYVCWQKKWCQWRVWQRSKVSSLPLSSKRKCTWEKVDHLGRSLVTPSPLSLLSSWDATRCHLHTHGLADTHAGQTLQGQI